MIVSKCCLVPIDKVENIKICKMCKKPCETFYEEDEYHYGDYEHVQRQIHSMGQDRPILERDIH